jgi:hypothetical protein
MTELAAVLSDIQRRLEVPKSRFNSFGKFSYRSCEDIVDAVKKLLPPGVYIKCTDEIEYIEGRHYVAATACICSSDGVICSTGVAREPKEKKGMDESQITGTSSSYARKYALCALFAIDDGNDADAKDDTEESVKKKKEEPATPRGLANRLLAKIETFTDAKALDKWSKDQAVADARDKIFMADSSLSREVDDALNTRLEYLTQARS